MDSLIEERNRLRQELAEARLHIERLKLHDIRTPGEREADEYMYTRKFRPEEIERFRYHMVASGYNDPQGARIGELEARVYVLEQFVEHLKTNRREEE